MTKTKGTCLTVSPLTKTKQILYELMLRESLILRSQNR